MLCEADSMKRDSSKKRSKLQVVSTKLLNEYICFEVYLQKVDNFCKKIIPYLG